MSIIARGDVHRDTMALFERDRGMPHIDIHLLHLIRRYHPDIRGAAPVAIARAKRRVDDERFVAVRIDVDELDHEVGVESVGRGEELEIDLTGNDQILLERIGLEPKIILALGNFALVHGPKR